LEGEANFSAFASQGVFAPWREYGFFLQAAIGEHGRTLTWPGGLDFCVDALWLEVAGKRPEDLVPNLGKERAAYAQA